MPRLPQRPAPPRAPVRALPSRPAATPVRAPVHAIQRRPQALQAALRLAAAAHASPAPARTPLPPQGGEAEAYDDQDQVDAFDDFPSEEDDDMYQNDDLEGDPDNYEQVGADISTSPEITWTIDRTQTGWRGSVRIPLAAGRMLQVTRTVEGRSPANGQAATSKALGAASKVLDNPAVAALLPPQAKLALQIARSKTARNVVKKLGSFF